MAQSGCGLPDTSVVVPLFNKAGYIERAMASVLGQTCRDCEIVVVDDGSADGGPEFVAGLARRDPRIRLVAQDNQGPGAARNRGMAEARAQVVAFLDADDEWSPRHLADIAELARLFPNAGLLATGYRQIVSDDFATDTTIDHAEPALLEDYFRRAAHSCPVHTSACAVRREAVDRVGGFVTGRLVRGEDPEFFARIALAYPVAYHPRVSSTYYRNAAGSKLSGELVSWIREDPLVAQSLRAALEDPGIAPELGRDVRAYVSHLLFGHALGGVAAGHYPDVSEMLDDPIIRQSELAWQVKLVRLAMRCVPRRALATWLRYRTSRYSMPAVRVREGMVIRCIRTDKPRS